jgi:hypothetical protein
MAKNAWGGSHLPGETPGRAGETPALPGARGRTRQN